MSDLRYEDYDVVVIGGGAAGLNGAIMLARSRRSVLVIDGGEPRNAPARAVHGLLGHEGMSPFGLLERGRRELEGFGGLVRRAHVVAVERSEGGPFDVTFDDGSHVRAERLLVATGAVDELPAVDGLAARWGRDVLHCPYCHGWEVRDTAIGVLATIPFVAVHHALLFRQLSDRVVVLANGVEFDDEDAAKLAARGIDIVSGPVERVEVADDRLTGVRLDGGDVVAVDNVVVATRVEARLGALADLGLEAAWDPSGMFRAIVADAMGRTAVPGVWVAGNAAAPMAQVGASAAAGAMAGAQINADLVMAEADSALSATVTS